MRAGDDARTTGCNQVIDFAGRGALMVGLLLAGIFHLVLAAEIDKDDTDIDKRTVYQVMVGAGFLVALGGYLFNGNGRALCGTERCGKYYGGIFVVVGLLGAGGFNVGAGLNMDNAANTQDVKTCLYLAASSLILTFVGLMMSYGANLVDVRNCGSFNTEIFGAWFLTLFLLFSGTIGLIPVAYKWGNAMNQDDSDDVAIFLYLAGVFEVLASLGSFFVGESLSCC